MKLPKMAELERGRVYKITSRNLDYGVWDGDTGFIGIRTKFGSRYLFTEIHRDASTTFGTVRTAEPTQALLPATTMLVDRRPDNPEAYAVIFALLEKVASELDTPTP